MEQAKKEGKRCSDLCTTYFYAKNFLRIKLPESLSTEDREEICNQLKGIINDKSVMVFDYRGVKDNMHTMTTVFQVFIIFLAIIAFVIVFFMLIVSAKTNLKDKMWEFGVLRAIGLRKAQLVRIYLYESIAVFTSSAIAGLVIGFILALTLSLQFNLFLELPLQVSFPTWLVVSMILLGLVMQSWVGVSRAWVK